ncbi:oxidoreductase-like domain-containing protein [Piscinibacter sakaiensis]|uniref:oxidoreductase-like domain-containing protein n=1 Tax=Piscinibacter sakaiensis TaxID=1547922 RepID=UPI003AAC129A
MATSRQPAPDPDPRPQPPPPLDDDACCGQGCEPCILEQHAEAVDRYREALAAWLQRHPQAAADGE